MTSEWKRTSYRTETCGEYAITGHEIMTAPGGHFFILWHGQQEIGTFTTAAEARQAAEGYGP